MKPVYRQAEISRRQFLSYLSLPAALYLAKPRMLLAGNGQQNFHSTSDFLTFVDRDGLGPRVDAPVVQNSYMPLHGEQTITKQIFTPDEIVMMKSMLKSEFEYSGIPWDDSFELSYSFQHYGVPDKSGQGRHLLAYCERVYDFLYSRINGLFNADMSWALLSDNEVPVNMDQGHFIGQVGRYTYYVLRVYVDHPDLDDLPSLINAQPLDRAIHFIVAGESSLPKHANLYVIPGQTSLVSPFSELLHLTFHAPSEHYAEELSKTLAKDTARQRAIDAGETINEATAILLAKEYINRFGSSDRIVTINNMEHSLNKRFTNLSNAISYIDRNGIQKSVDLYLENPSKFMRKVSRA